MNDCSTAQRARSLAEWQGLPAKLARLTLLALLTRLALPALLTLTGCAGTPPPDWQMNAHGALERAVAAHLAGVDRVATLEFKRARSALAATGRPDLVARGELLRCAADVAGLQFGPCAGFEPLRQDAHAAELAYADHVFAAQRQAPISAERQALLPPAQRVLAAPPDGSAADLARLQSVNDPLSRLVGAALWLRDGRASPAVMALAVDTASAQGWRRPLLAWLQAASLQAQASGNAADAARLERRMQLVLKEVLGGVLEDTLRKATTPAATPAKASTPG